MSPPKARRRFVASYKVLPLAAVSALILWLSWRRFGGASALSDSLQNADTMFLALSPVCAILALLVATTRWWAVLAAMGYRTGYMRAIYATLAAWPLALIAPSRANDLLRAHVLRRDIPPPATMGSVVAERIIDVQSLIFLTTWGLLSIGRGLWAALTGSLLIASALFVRILLAQGPRIAALPALSKYRERIEVASKALRTLFDRPRELIRVSLFSLLAWGTNLLLFYCLVKAFAAGPSWNDIVALWPIAIFISLLPISFGGIGTRDAAFLWLSRSFASSAVHPVAVLSATLGYAACTLGLYALLGLPCMAAWLLDSGNDDPKAADDRLKVD
jgi:uncharacterized protein (TIRG00374 family)